MRLDNLPRSDRIEDRRGGRSGGIRGARSGGIGIGTVVVLGLVGWALGVDPRVLIQGATCCRKPVGPNKRRRPNQALRPMLRVGCLRDSW